MHNKKLNLLPQEYKNRYINKYLLMAGAMICGVLALALLAAHLNLYVLRSSISDLTQESAEYESEANQMNVLQTKVNSSKKIIEEFSRENFEFAGYLSTLESNRPSSVTILSLDSIDRLTEPSPTAMPEASATPSPEATPSSPPMKQNISRICPAKSWYCADLETTKRKSRTISHCWPISHM